MPERVKFEERWLARNAQRFEPWSVTVMTDDLHSHQPLCELLREHNCHFILTCRSESHPTLLLLGPITLSRMAIVG